MLAAVATQTLPIRERGVCCAPPRRLRPERVERLNEVLKALADGEGLGGHRGEHTLPIDKRLSVC